MLMSGQGEYSKRLHKPVTSRSALLLAAAGALALAYSSGCASGNVAARPWLLATPGPVWPDPPEVERIAYCGSIRGAGDLGVRRSAAGRFLDVLSGENTHERTFVNPVSVAVTTNGDMYIADIGLPAVLHYDAKRRNLDVWKKAGDSKFIFPVSVAASGSGVFVGDTGLGRVFAMDRRGRVIFSITNRIERPAAVAVSDELLLVADSQRHSILGFTMAGEFAWEFGQRGTADGQFNFPTHVACGPEGKLYVSDSMNFRVQVFDREHRFLSACGSVGDSSGQLSRPKGVAADRDGNVFIVDAQFDNVQIFDAAGRFLLHWGGNGSGPGEFWMPSGIIIAPDGFIYIADTYNRRIQVFKRSDT